MSHPPLILLAAADGRPCRREADVADRRAGKGPYVRDEGGGTQPRSRNKDGTWRAKRSDAGKSRGSATGKSTGRRK